MSMETNTARVILTSAEWSGRGYETRDASTAGTAEIWALRWRW